MSGTHLLGVEVGAGELAGLVADLAAVGHRVGWLDLGSCEPPPELREAARLPLLRAVVVGPSGSVAFKSRMGSPVLRDLVREHFAGCRLVLVRGERSLPRLRPADGRWAIEAPAGDRIELSTAELATALGRPRPW